MSLVSQKMYLVYCDQCNMPKEDADNNATCYFDKEEAERALKTAIEDEEWVAKGKKHYCPECAKELNLV